MVSAELVPMKGSGEEEGDSSLLYSFEILENSEYLEVGVKGGGGASDIWRQFEGNLFRTWILFLFQVEF